MKYRYGFKILVSTTLFAALVSGCNTYLEPSSIASGTDFSITLGGGVNGVEQDVDAIKQLQVYSFLQKDKPTDGGGGGPLSQYSHRVVGLTYSNNTVTTKTMRAGLWDIAMMSPKGATFTEPLPTKEANQALMYTFSPNSNSNKAHEFYYGYSRLPEVVANTNLSVNAGLARNVAKVKVVVARAVDIDNGATDHSIEINNVPNKISWAGTLLKSSGGNYVTDKGAFDVLANGTISGSPKFKDHSSDAGVSVSDTLEFIIPAHRGKDFWSANGDQNHTPKDTITKKLTIKVNFKKKSNGTRFIKSVDIPHVPRCNMVLVVHVKMKDVNIEVDSDVEGWVTEEVDGDVDAPNLNVSPTITTYDAAMSRLHFSCDQPWDSVYIMPFGKNNAGAKVTVDDFFDNISGPRAFKMEYNQDTGLGFIDIANTHMDYDANTSNIKLYLNASGLRREITVKRSISAQAQKKIAVPYIGTFHRWFEKGERIVTWHYDKNKYWTAFVDDPKGSVGSLVTIDRFAGSAFLDKSIYGTSPSPAEGNYISGRNMVSGKGTIYFRVGWNSPLGSADANPRYATISVREGRHSEQGNLIQKLYLRQGEKPSVVQAHSGSVPFSPYNLTTTETKLNSPIGIKGGLLTEYPTQAGAYFQWMDPINQRFAYSPVGRPYGTWYSKPPIFEAYWGEKTTGMEIVKDVHETCPPNYRRVNDGATDKEPSKTEASEMRATLWDNPANPAPSNTLSGYYADGFFDRHAIVNSASGAANSTAGSGLDVAYRGVLFINATTKASLFFPAAGQRFVDNGELKDLGAKGYYWTSSSTVEAEKAGEPKAPAGKVQITTLLRNTAVTIRCVYDRNAQ